MGFLDRLLSPVGDYMVQHQTFLPDTIEVIEAANRWAILGYDEFGKSPCSWRRAHQGEGRGVR
jgi:hypothetical protein